MARSGDLGYTTGPYTLTDNSPEKKPPQHGFFFSVWKKQMDGNWRVVLDAGIRTAGPYRGLRTFQTVPRLPRESAEPLLEPKAGKKMLLSAERGLLEAAATEGFMKAFLAHLSSDARVYRQDVQPVIGVDSVRAFLLRAAPLESWEPMKAEVARSVDLGYTYGSYRTRESHGSTATEKGYYVRVWKRDATDRWLVVLDLTIPLPPGEDKSK